MTALTKKKQNQQHEDTKWKRKTPILKSGEQPPEAVSLVSGSDE